MAFSYQWSREEQRKWAEERLFRYIRAYVDKFHPYYRELFRLQGIDTGRIYTYDEFSKIPITGRQELLSDQKAFVMQTRLEDSAYEVEPLPAGKRLGYAARAFTTRYLRDVYGMPRSFKEKAAQAAMYEWMPVQYNFSAGTTGMPAACALTASDQHRNLRKIYGMLYATGWEPRMRTLNLLPARPHFDFFAPVTAAFTLDTGAAILHACGSEAAGSEQQAITSSLLGFEAIISHPGHLLYWLKSAVELKERGLIEGLPGIEMVIAAAETVTDAYRKRLKECLAELGSPDVRIVEFYGSTEMKAGFFECDEKMGVHLNPEFFYWEVLDPETRQPVKWGEPGVLVFSHIDWRGTVLLRYWTGDLVQGGMVWEKCPACGLTVPRIFTPIVRAEEGFSEIKGSRRPLLDFQRALHGVQGLEAFQVVLGRKDQADELSPDKVTICAGASPGLEEADLRNRIVNALRLEMEMAPDEVVFMETAAITVRLFERTGCMADWVVDRRGESLEEEPPALAPGPEPEAEAEGSPQSDEE